MTCLWHIESFGCTAGLVAVGGHSGQRSNADGSPHQVTKAGASLSAVILNGQTAQLSIAEPAPMISCGLHPAIKGKVEVSWAR